MIAIRPATPADADALRAILKPVIRAGQTYALARVMTREAGLVAALVMHRHLQD